MEIKRLFGDLKSKIMKYKYILLVVLIGISIMIIPIGTSKENANNEISITQQEEELLEDKLTVLLKHTDGVGDVKVLLTKGEGEEIVFQTDTDRADGQTDSTVRNNTVTITDGNRGQTGLVRQVNPPKYLGAVIVCQGADDPNVRLQIVDAVSKATGLTANRISILKMK